MGEHLIWPIVGAIISAIISAIVGQLAVKRTKENVASSEKKLHLWWIASLSIGILVFLLGRWAALGSSETLLQGVQAKPNFVHPGDRVTISVQLDRPAPKNGVSVILSSSDPAILAVDGNAEIYEGHTIGTGYFQVVGTPTYPSPVSIIATLNDSKVQTDINVGTAPVKLLPTPASHPVVMRSASAPSSSPSPSPTDSLALPPKKTLDPELLGRFDEAQGQLSSEEGYWNGVKQHMPPGTSLRPEITSQIFAANSAIQRCQKARDAVDASSLSTCIDVLNDHLTQLKIQH